MNNATLNDSFGRKIEYLRLSITDRCDFRCIYCMAEDMTFLPRKEVLTLEELEKIASAFVNLGVKKIRITGGEPLIRQGAIGLFQKIRQLPQLEELCLTTNGSQLLQTSRQLVEAGVDRINISLDTLKPDRFKALTRHGDLHKVLQGIDAAKQAGFKKIKINAVLMRHYNLDEAKDLAMYAIQHGFDISFIEEMPLGEIQSHQRDAEFVSSQDLRDILSKHIPLEADNFSTGGPSRYWKTPDGQSRIGFISPHSENFCDSCNRVRVTTAGKLLLCLGNEHSVDLKQVLRSGTQDIQDNLQATIINAMQIKPEKHEFDLDQQPQILRFMNTTGG